jgi:hypothetical protein
MRFLSMIRVQENTGMQPSERMMSEMGKLMTEMKSAGKLLDTAALAPTAQSKRVRLRGGKISVVDGPFTETKEVVGGYAMLNAQSLEEAIALTSSSSNCTWRTAGVDCEYVSCMSPISTRRFLSLFHRGRAGLASTSHLRCYAQRTDWERARI